MSTSFNSMGFDSPQIKKRKKVDSNTYKKRCSKGLNQISNVISRVVLSRKKIIWDVLEEIRANQIDINISPDKSNRSLEYSSVHRKSPSGRSSHQNSKTEPSTEVEAQVFDKIDLDYYFLERLEKMRD